MPRTPKKQEPIRRVAAALPVIYGPERTMVVLITSRTTRRFIATKGAIKPRESARACAKREALEEAGVIGSVSRKPVAHLTPVGGEADSIPLYLLTVETLLDDWEERSVRDRMILSPARAALLVDDPVLISVLLHLATPEE